MSTLGYIVDKFNVDLNKPNPIHIPNVTRWVHLVGLFAELGYRTGAEIGVEKGKFSRAICIANPSVKLYCIDPWLAKTYQHINHDLITQQNVNQLYQEAQANLAPFNCLIIRKPSEFAIEQFKPNQLDFVYIDGNHGFEYVVNDIISWSKIIRPGGIVSGHDYRPNDVEGVDFHVQYAVDAYTEVHRISPWFVMDDNEDGGPSWFWVKQ